ncbi:aminotransferase class I/II-fold pyridoxal phosphate-dependent enzyme [Paenibacillus rhizovicinus]|uniref:Aminotransferase class I/II-fold pyridoxal phosphate-dependent enzyme n=1 Tax=Paenibacillus rhizovicinus TaxID=2704463 RepID=A0A6C0P149_9BACL|nr:aminotransferase class I/II-fold pyridoxal phosphate-dependent enzyme [Paenibacillus rhizovicinus]QHW32179.1 aminotransferase class I/II-fold pyridoxal phosphate-dependent enzyme [Paenibacillus rhizovicinus]
MKPEDYSMTAQPHKPWHAPLFDTLVALKAACPVSFHVPGHKYGQSIANHSDTPIAALQSLTSVMNIDVTELSVTDDLHAPSGVIEEAQCLAAAAFGAEQTFFLVGGSTAGNLAMLLAVCEPDDLIIVQRNAHKSVLNGLKLAGARAVFLMPEREAETGLDVVPSLELVEQALQQYPEAKAIFLTNPSYYGLHVNLGPYANLIHRYGKLLLVDEAHGAHYGLHPAFPQSAIQAGADAVVQSTHKTLQALTMGAMLHLQGERINRQAIVEALRMIQSSSPSYPIMASLDITRAMIETRGHEMFERGLEAADAFRRWVNEQDGYRIAEAAADGVKIDPLRISLCDATGKLTGFDLQKKLEAFGCYTELADSTYAVLIFGMEASSTDVDRLQQALLVIQKEVSEEEAIHARYSGTHHSTMQSRLSAPVKFSRFGVKSSSGRGIERIRLEEAEGRYSAEAVIPYPPGIPLLYEGELISSEVIRVIKQLVADGARCQGAVDQTMRTIAVSAER